MALEWGKEDQHAVQGRGSFHRVEPTSTMYFEIFEVKRVLDLSSLDGLSSLSSRLWELTQPGERCLIGRHSAYVIQQVYFVTYT